jgi:hypothetical protein
MILPICAGRTDFIIFRAEFVNLAEGFRASNILSHTVRVRLEHRCRFHDGDADRTPGVATNQQEVRHVLTALPGSIALYGQARHREVAAAISAGGRGPLEDPRRGSFLLPGGQLYHDAICTLPVTSETHRPITFAMLGSTYGLNAPSHPSGNSFGASDDVGSLGAAPCPDGFDTAGVCVMRLATMVMRSAGSNRYNMRPSRSRTVTTASDLPSTSTEIAGRNSP